jgi:cell division protein FtsL
VVPSETRRRLGLPRLSLRTGVVLTVLLFAALFAVAVSHALLIESQVRLDSLGEQVAAEQARYEELRREVAELESPERIVAEAQERLGMVEPNEVVWLTPDQPPPADGDADEGDGAAEAAASGGEGGEEAAETPDTSWANVKPYLETTR